MFDRIAFDSEIMGGRACIRGMRIPVSVIVGRLHMAPASRKSWMGIRTLRGRISSRRLNMQHG